MRTSSDPSGLPHKSHTSQETFLDYSNNDRSASMNEVHHRMMEQSEAAENRVSEIQA